MSQPECARRSTQQTLRRYQNRNRKVPCQGKRYRRVKVLEMDGSEQARVHYWVSFCEDITGKRTTADSASTSAMQNHLLLIFPFRQLVFCASSELQELRLEWAMQELGTIRSGQAVEFGRHWVLQGDSCVVRDVLLRVGPRVNSSRWKGVLVEVVFRPVHNARCVRIDPE